MLPLFYQGILVNFPTYPPAAFNNIVIVSPPLTFSFLNNAAMAINTQMIFTIIEG